MSVLKHSKKDPTEEFEVVEGGGDGSGEDGGSPEIEALKVALAEAKDEAAQLRDQLMRSVADFQNFRKRSEAEKLTLRQFANERFAVDLLPVLDNFERTFAAMQGGSSLESIMGGIQAVERQLRSVLETHNVTRIVAHGQQFDPELHEAVATDPSSEHPENTVIHELQPGYKMAERVIRPAHVRVSTKP
jgi:molecular chaperone GrpE